MKIAVRIGTIVLFVALLVGTVLFLIFGPRPAAIGTGGLAVLFGVMAVRDVRDLVREAVQKPFRK